MGEQKKRKVLHVVSSLKKNGTETFIMNIFRNIDREKYSFDFLVFNDHKDGYYEEAISLGAKIFYIPPRKQNPLKYIRNLKRFFSEHRGEYDVVHMNDMSMTTLAPLKYAKRYGVPVRIIHMHSSNCQGIHNKALHAINKHFVDNIATNYLGCAEAALNWGFSNTKIRREAIVINNGIDIEKFKFNQNNRDKIRNELNLSPEDNVLIHVGSFNTVKNHSFLLDVFKLAKAEIPYLKLIMIGDGPLWNDIKEKSNISGLNNDILFLGRKDNIPDYMSSADCLLLPSLHEGLPMVLIEAQASGLPVVTSTGVSDEAKVSDSFQRLSLEDNKRNWINAIKKSIALKNYDRKVPETIDRFSVSTTIDALEKIYNS